MFDLPLIFDLKGRGSAPAASAFGHYILDHLAKREVRITDGWDWIEAHFARSTSPDVEDTDDDNEEGYNDRTGYYNPFPYI